MKIIQNVYVNGNLLCADETQITDYKLLVFKMRLLARDVIQIHTFRDGLLISVMERAVERDAAAGDQFSLDNDCWITR